MRMRTLVVGAAALLVAGACGGDRTGDEASDGEPARAAAGRVVTPPELDELSLSAPVVVAPAGAMNPTSAIDPASGTLFLAWAREVPGTPAGVDVEPVLEAVVARSTDRGKTFSEPVVVNGPDDRVGSSVVFPTHVAVGPNSDVYVLYQHEEDSPPTANSGSATCAWPAPRTGAPPSPPR